MTKTIRIGSGTGYAGDRLEPSLELIEKGNLDYISYECLAERTIAIGQQAKLKDPSKGYNGLLEHRMEKALPLCWKHKVKLITNMGSANPQAAAQKCVEIARRHGLTGMKIACVTGDDLLPVINKYMDAEVWETHEPLSKLPGEIVSANAYMGVEGILKALEQGADVVITGRVADPAIFMAPAIHAFGWSLEDWDKLGKGTMIGHLLEATSPNPARRMSPAWATWASPLWRSPRTGPSSSPRFRSPAAWSRWRPAPSRSSTRFTIPRTT